MKKKSVNRIISLMLVLFAIVSVFNTLVVSADIEYEKYKDFEYTFKTDGTIELNSYLGNEKIVVVPEKINGITVTSFGRDRFGNGTFCGKQMEQVIIPDSVNYFYPGTFGGCYNLVSVTFPKGITSITSYMFRGCKSLEEIVIPETVKTIYEYAFSECTALKRVVFNENLTKIGNYAFSECTALENIYIPGNVKEIGDNAFMLCTGLSEVIMEDGITEMRSGVFRYCSSLESVKLPEGEWLISQMFFGCTSLKEVILPSTLKRVNNKSFTDCPIEKIVFPGTRNYWRVYVSWYDSALMSSKVIFVPYLGAIYGDYTKDENITTDDALYALRASVGLIDIDDDTKKVIDVNGDKNVTTDDALLILKRSVGLIDSFPVE